MFIKRGDGKILTVIQDENELTEEQKESVKKMSEDFSKSLDSADSSKQEKKSGS